METYSKLLVAGLISLQITGCAISRKMMTPDGENGYYISCNGLAVGMNVCYKKASEVCPDGYTIIESQNSTGNGLKKGIFIECKSDSASN